MENSSNVGDNSKERKGLLHPPNKSKQQQPQATSFLSSMRRHLPKATIHSHLDAMAQWSRFKAAKRFEALTSMRDTSHHHHHHASNKRTFKVQVPMRLLVWTCGIFLVIPLTIFGWKELHITAISSNKEDIHSNHHHVRSSSHPNEDAAHWMEDHLYQKTTTMTNTNSNESKNESAIDSTLAIVEGGTAIATTTTTPTGGDKESSSSSEQKVGAVIPETMNADANVVAVALEDTNNDVANRTVEEEAEARLGLTEISAGDGKDNVVGDGVHIVQIAGAAPVDPTTTTTTAASVDAMEKEVKQGEGLPVAQGKQDPAGVGEAPEGGT